MSVPQPKVIATLSSRTLVGLRADCRRAREEGADVAEVRLDRLDPSEVPRLPQLFPSPLPLLATLRSRAEGGEGPDAKDARRPVLESAAAMPFELVDVERARDLPMPPDSALSAQDGRLVVSSHTASSPTLERALEAPGVEADLISFRKLVGPASIGDFLRRVVPAASHLHGVPTVVLTTGPSGALSRAWAHRLRLPAVYAALGPSIGGVEPSQLPVDLTRTFLDAGGDGPIFGVAGHPVAHSASPQIHHDWMRATRRAGLYVPLDFESAAEFRAAVPQLAAGGFRGLNITHPLKEAGFELATEKTPRCRVVGAANVLSFERERIVADNTDVVALTRRLRELVSAGAWDGGELTVVGSGGAARAALAAAQQAGFPARVIGRNLGRVADLARAFGVESERRPPLGGTSLVIHGTPAGREDTPQLEVDLGPWLTERSYLLDLVYRPRHDLLRRAAERAGARYEDGWRILVYQAVESFRTWWGEPPPTDAVDASLRGA